MAEQSDLDLLRAAAARVHELDQSATPGPWTELEHVDDPGDEGWWVLGGGVPGSAGEHAVLVAVDYNPNAEADARYAAAFRAVAEPLDDWLTAEADFHEHLAALNEFAATLGWKATTASSTLPQALAVARALLGEVTAGLLAPTAEPCSCDGRRWVDDEGWSPELWERAEPRRPGAGLVPCGFCNHGGWNVDEWAVSG